MIKKNKVIAKLEQNQLALGAWIMSNSAVSAEIMSQAGFDWVCVDAEHSQVTKETALEMFRAIELHGAEPFVRISLNDEVEMKKYLDMGARGIIVPMIKSYEEVRRAITFIKYPPQGTRSYALPRCTGYGEWSNEYFKKANDEIFIAIMIEHIDSIQDLDKIFSCPEINAVFVGPYDLSGSMGIPGEFDNPKFIGVIDLINRKAVEHRITMGFHEVHPTPEKINKLVESGVRFIACGIDTIFLIEKSKEFAKIGLSE
ncbi:2-dehydro-3,6-dideoxy-6-sulfogluconate aldolase [bioreactor metagenome]|uniref:2-dehydro-3,6-dideoxy-6-sulfogluconate aldolase n=1 Tax=bioreactor metagenome TaxID=1076179 RepID=A0A645BSQ0_9ZZZZ|nr:aldolase/citrate lyase family protein [Paludibacter sp.]